MLLSEIDLHYHAGMERQGGASLADYLDHAVATGRRFIGLTDHVGRYMDGMPQHHHPGIYSPDLAGLLQYRGEMEALRPLYPELAVFFAPEYPHTTPLGRLAEEWLAPADYCICELTFDERPEAGPGERTDIAISYLGDVARLRERSGKPTYFAHPLRDSMNRRIYDPPELDPAVIELARRASATLDCADLNALFECDLAAIGQAAGELNVALEVNGETRGRILRILPELYPAYIAAYRLMCDNGARLVAGTDQHDPRHFPAISGWTEPIALLGPESLDVGFYQSLGIKVELESEAPRPRHR